MRKLTKAEIENSPHWAKYYYVNTKNKVSYDPHKCVGYELIREFDINQYKYSHGGIELHSVCDVNGDLYIIHYGNVHRRTKEDAIAEAKHFKLTSKDLS